jgi:hypothetical protein
VKLRRQTFVSFSEEESRRKRCRSWVSMIRWVKPSPWTNQLALSKHLPHIHNNINPFIQHLPILTCPTIIQSVLTTNTTTTLALSVNNQFYHTYFTQNAMVAWEYVVYHALKSITILQAAVILASIARSTQLWP